MWHNSDCNKSLDCQVCHVGLNLQYYQYFLRTVGRFVQEYILVNFHVTKMRNNLLTICTCYDNGTARVWMLCNFHLHRNTIHMKAYQRPTYENLHIRIFWIYGMQVKYGILSYQFLSKCAASDARTPCLSLQYF